MSVFRPAVSCLVPEYLPIAETCKGIEHLARFDLHIRKPVSNKLLLESVSDPFFKARLDWQQQYRNSIISLSERGQA